MCNAWGLSDDDPARLLGDVQDDQVQRTGVLVGIRVALMAILGGRCRRVRGRRLGTWRCDEQGDQHQNRQCLYEALR